MKSLINKTQGKEKNNKTQHKRYKTSGYKKSRYKKSGQKKTINKSRLSKLFLGGSLMDFVIHEETNKSTLPFDLNKYTKLFTSNKVTANANAFRVLFNYRSPYQIDITLKQHQTIPSNQLMNKPYIFVPNMNSYLIVLVAKTNEENTRLLWLASYKNRSWERDICSYIPPSPKPGKMLQCILLVYKYPLDFNSSNMYKSIDLTNTKRKQEYRNFQIFLATNKNIQLIPGYSKYFNVKYDEGSTMSFLSNLITNKKRTKTTELRRIKI